MQLARVARRAVAIAGVLALVPAAGPAAQAPAWSVHGGQVVIVVPLKPGGAFEAKTSSLRGALTPASGAPLALAGELSVDLATIETGISLRNRHLRENYLEVQKGEGFDEAVLSEIVLSDAADTGFRGETEFTGTLLLHGVSRPISGTGEIRGADTGVRVEASFSLTLTDFDVEPPEYLGVGVADKIAVTVSFGARRAR